MEILTVKVGDEIRSRHSRPSEPPIGVLADAANGEVVISLRDSDDDLPVAMHRLARTEHDQREQKRIRERRIERRGRRRYA